MTLTTEFPGEGKCVCVWGGVWAEGNGKGGREGEAWEEGGVWGGGTRG